MSNLPIWTCGCGKVIEFSPAESIKNHVAIHDLRDIVPDSDEYDDYIFRYVCRECKNLAVEFYGMKYRTYISELSLAFRDDQKGRRKEREQKEAATS